MKKMKRKLLLVPVMVAALLVSAVTGLLPVGRAEAAGKTGAGLAAYAQSAYSRGAQYVWGGVGPNGYDCSGLIYAYAGGAHNSEALLGLCTETGSASSIPDIPGLLLWRPGHVGVYVGGGMAIDARGTQYGIVYESAAGKWQKWGKLSMLSYGGSATTGGGNTTGTPVTPISPNKPSSAATTNNNTNTNNQTQEPVDQTPEEPQEPEITDLLIGTQGEAVTRIQTRLSELGYYYEGINDYFDLCLSDAVTAFQEVNGIYVNGAAYVAMQELAYSDDAKENPERGTIKPGLHSSVVTQMQDRLVNLGYLDVDPTGFYGETTKEAVMAYQQQSGLEENGILTAEDLDVLYSEAAVAAPQPEPSEAPSSEPSSAPSSSEASSAVLSSGSVRLFDDVVPTVAAAAVDGTDGSGSQNNSGVFAMVLILLCAGLTTVFFVVRKNKKSIQSFGVAVIQGVSKIDLKKLLKRK